MVVAVGMGRFWMYHRGRAGRLGMNVKVGKRQRDGDQECLLVLA